MTILRRLVATGVVAAPASAIGAALYYRPDPSSRELQDAQSWLARKFKSKEELADRADAPDPPLMTAARFMTISLVSAASKAWMYGANDFAIKDDARYRHLVRSVRYRPRGKPLLTVANHNSTMDDPALVASMVPWSVNLTPSQMRWSLCTQEICFINAFTSAFFGSGKVMPIERGDGVDQAQLLAFARRLASGAWCNIFPEARTVQLGRVGGRMGANEADIGTLKWGVGKLIAHAPVRPEIIPVYHTGMQNVIPEHPVSRDVLDFWPGSGHHVTFRAGPPIVVDDLIDAYERANGPLWKYTPSVEQDPPNFTWSSTAKERALYSAITRRVQEALEELEEEARSDLGDAFPTKPKVVLSGAWRRMAGEDA